MVSDFAFFADLRLPLGTVGVVRERLGVAVFVWERDDVPGVLVVDDWFAFLLGVVDFILY